jgi:hypothetical protein
LSLQKIKPLVRSPVFLLLVVITAFVISLFSVSSVNVNQMGSEDTFIFEVIPIPYWICICVITVATLLIIPSLPEKRSKIIFLFSTIILITCLRMVFPIIFTSIPAFEPDTLNYMNVVNSWVVHGLDFGVQGNYQHNFPLSFVFAFAMVKLGVSVDSFYRFAPFVIYAIELILVYFITDEVVPDKGKSSIPAIATFLFSLSSLGYWVTVHFCPDLFGSLLTLVCLYLAIKFAKTGAWSFKLALPVFASIFLLILSHHLSTVYLIVTFFGFSIASWYFKPRLFKSGTIIFFILGIFTYTTWFVYGTLMYPDFFNVYIYFSGFSSVTTQSAGAGLINNLAFIVYPLFIFSLFSIEFLSVTHIRNPKIIFKNLRSKIKEFRKFNDNNLIVFVAGFILVAFLFVAGIGLPVLFGTRILEVLCIGLYPLASQALLNFIDVTSSKKKKVVLVVIVLIVILVSVYRYYTQIQRRVIIG